MSNCPSCGMLTDPQLEHCVHCGRLIPRSTPPPRSKSAKPTSSTCPNCGAMVRDSEVICINCRTNLITGQVIPDTAEPLRPFRRSRRIYYLLGGLGVGIVVAAVLWIFVF